MGGWEICSCQPEDMWRGLGIAFDPSEWALLRRKLAGRGLWCRFRNLTDSTELWIGTFHFTQGCTQDQHATEVSSFLAGLPATTHPVIVAGDANASVQWSVADGEIFPYGVAGKTHNMLGLIQGAGFRFCPPRADQLDTPTSRPRKAGDQGHQIDLFACKHVDLEAVHIHVDSHRVLGSDHDLLSATFRRPARDLGVGKSCRRAHTRPRKVVRAVPPVAEINQKS